MIRPLTLGLLALALTACASRATPEPQLEPVPTATEAAPMRPTAVPGAAASPRPEPTVELVVQRSNFLLLGQDWRAHRLGTGRGYQTDVIVLVSVWETDPLEITVIQYPRNLYVDVPTYRPTWLFSVWREHGYQGLHDWWQRAFGVSVQGVFLTDMDRFVAILGDLGMDGEETLAFLRDNENNWSYGTYDKEQRVFQVLRELWAKSQVYFLSNPIVAVNAVLGRWPGMIESDLSAVQQLVYVFDLGWKVRSSEHEVRFVQLEEPALKWDWVPDLNVPKGMTAAVDLSEWHACILDWKCEDE